MVTVPFAGDKKKGVWILANAEKRMVNWLVPKVPSWLETYHLTMLTLAWSAGIVLASLMATQNIHWLWLVSAFIALQYLTDVLDGAVGRHRNTGLIKWGFYMDHFLSFAATNEFKISALGIGPTEIRIFFIVVNAGIIFFGSAWLAAALPIVTVILTAFLAWMVFSTHKHLWQLDMEHKQAAEQIASPENLVS